MSNDRTVLYEIIEDLRIDAERVELQIVFSQRSGGDERRIEILSRVQAELEKTAEYFGICFEPTFIGKLNLDPHMRRAYLHIRAR
jgi:hypothetical protein